MNQKYNMIKLDTLRYQNLYNELFIKNKNEQNVPTFEEYILGIKKNICSSKYITKYVRILEAGEDITKKIAITLHNSWELMPDDTIKITASLDWIIDTLLNPLYNESPLLSERELIITV